MLKLSLESWASVACLSVVMLACIFHMTAHIGKHSAESERWGFILTGAGAFGQIVYFFWPRIESFNFELLMHFGMVLIAYSIVRGHLRAFIGRLPGMGWTDRRATRQSSGMGD